MLFVFDTDENIVAFLQNKSGSKACPYYEATVIEQLNGEFTFEFLTLSGHRDAKHLIRGNGIGFWFNDRFLKFTMSHTDDEHGEGLIKTVMAEHCVIVELNDDIVRDKRPADVTADVALSGVLSDTVLGGTRWGVGTVGPLGTATPENIYYESPLSGVQKIIQGYKTDYAPRLEVNENKIIDRFIDIGTRGKNTGRRFVNTRDLIQIKREEDTTGLKTALVGRGKGEESGNGYGRRIDFSNVEWSVANGDPVDKPLGQDWVGDPNALNQFGDSDGSGGKRHKLGTFEDSDETDPEVLLTKTWEHLQTINKPRVTYTAKIIDLGELTGLDHQKIDLGDTITIIDREFVPEIAIQARVIEIKRVLGEPEKTEVKLGNYVPLLTDETLKIEEIERKIGDRSGIWESGVGPVTNEDFEDITPSVPANATAEGLFKTIVIDWDLETVITMAQYEVYASKTINFTPTSSNMVWRGYGGGYVHKANTNEQWYFRIRGVNKRGTPGPFTSQLSANTQRVTGSEIEPLTITNGLIAENAQLDFAKIANVQISSGMINVTSLTSITANLGEITAGDIYGVYINGSEFVSIYEASTGIYGSMRLVDDGMTFKQGFSDGFDASNPTYNDYERTTEFKSYGINYYHEQKSIGFREFVLNDRQLKWNGSGGNNTGSFDILITTTGTDIGTHNGFSEDLNIRSSGNLKLNGSVWNNQWLDKNNPYIWSANLSPRNFSGSLRTSMAGTVNMGAGWLGQYGNVHWFGSSSSGQDGAGLQLWVPYRTNANGTSVGDGKFAFRTGRYNNAGWGDWRQFVSTNSAGEIDEVLKFDGASFPQLNAIDHNGAGSHIYIRPSSVGEVRATVMGSTSTYVPVRASSFPTGSLEEFKQDIELMESSGLDIILKSDIHKYRLKNDVKNGINRIRYGLVIGEGRRTPDEIIDGDGVEQYAMNSLSFKGIQEMYYLFSGEINELKERILMLENQLKTA